LSFRQNPALIAFAPFAEPKFSMSTFARLNQRIYEDPAFAPAFMQNSAVQSELGRFGNVACVDILLHSLFACNHSAVSGISHGTVT
jgi:hypothetical protein